MTERVADRESGHHGTGRPEWTQVAGWLISGRLLTNSSVPVVTKLLLQ